MKWKIAKPTLEELQRELRFKDGEIYRLRRKNAELESVMTGTLLEGTGIESANPFDVIKSLCVQVISLKEALQTERRDHLNAVPLAKEVEKLRGQANCYRRTLEERDLVYQVHLHDKQQAIDELIETHNVLVNEVEQLREQLAGLTLETKEAEKRKKCVEQAQQAHYTFLKEEVRLLKRRISHLQKSKSPVNAQIMSLLAENERKDKLITFLRENLSILKGDETPHTYSSKGSADYFLGISAQREVNRLAGVLNRALRDEELD